MLALSGIYKNGNLVLDKNISFLHPQKVIVTFLDEEFNDDEKIELKFSDFSFSKSRKILEDYKGSFSESLIEDRRL